MIAVQRVRAAIVSEMRRAFPGRTRALHEDRIREQAAGNLTYLVARSETRVVGHVMLLHGDRDFDPFRERFACAEVADLWVNHASRRRGVAKAMMRACERRARNLGYTTIGLATGPDSGYGPAKALYAELGYAFATGPYIESWRTPADDGTWKPDWELLSGYLVKSLLRSQSIKPRPRAQEVA